MIFEDPSQRRWRFTVVVFSAILIAAIFLFATWIFSVIVNPPLSAEIKRVQNRRAARQAAAQIIKADPFIKLDYNKYRKNHPNLKSMLVASNSSSLKLNDLNSDKILTTAFLNQYDAESIRSYKDHKNSIDAVFPDWYFVTKNVCDVKENVDPEIAKILEGHSAVIPRLTNFGDGGWKGKETSYILNHTEIWHCLASTVGELTKKAGVAGINVDFEDLQPEDREPFLEFLNELAKILHHQGQLLTVDVAAHDPAYDIEYIGSVADGVVLMAYDEHFSNGSPGPIASNDWFSDTIDEVKRAVPADKIIVALGAYGYDWSVSSTRAHSLTFYQTISLAKELSIQPELDTQSGNMNFSYYDEKNTLHRVWFLNGVTAWNEWKQMSAKGITSVGLWRLGTEDPSFWYLFEKPNVKGSDFAKVPALKNVSYASEGEIFTMRSSPQSGSLNLTFDDGGSIDYAQYQDLPSGYELERVGPEFPPKSLVLTFDDGPDEIWTPKIISTLQRYKVPAVFFVVGDQAQRYPNVVRSLAKNNFDIGNHTYLHPDISQISDMRLRLELNQTQRVIESAYGRKTILFRPPYDTDSSPSTEEQLRPISNATKLGYFIVGSNIDSEDWLQPGTEKIVKRIESNVLNPVNHIIVMHDAGGNREQTVEALERIIPDLQAAGYHFISLEQATGLAKNYLNPTMSSGESFIVQFTTIFYTLKRWGWVAIVWLFFLTTALSIFRILFLGAVVIRSVFRHRSGNRNKKEFSEPVSVLVPAFNEEKTIRFTIEAILKSTYDKFEIIVINDGSSDHTAEEVLKIAALDHRVRLISIPNSGKAAALNKGIQEAKNEIVVTIDADTIFYPETLSQLLQPFTDPKTDAVCGNVEVGNVHNLITGFQALEYVTTQNFDRRAFDEFNCISVVPGATGAWRKSRVIQIGGYTSDTLTEDADLTLRLLAAGGRIVYPAEARSKTEAPETIGALARQRFRWSFGTYQCLWKNRGLFFNGSLGWIALPNMFFFQVLFPILSPIGDVVFILSIFRGDIQAVFYGYLLFLLMDLAGSLLAFAIEKRPIRLMWLVLIQRFFYRQFMYIIAYRALVAILRGKKQEWNKLDRTGRAAAQPTV